MASVAPTLPTSEAKPLSGGLNSSRLNIASKVFAYFAQLRTEFDVDIESYQILSAFTLAGLAEGSKLYGPAASFRPELFKASLTATALSEMSRIPRETVRRKLKHLKQQGYLQRGDDGAYIMDRYWPDFDIVLVIQRALQVDSSLDPN